MAAWIETLLGTEFSLPPIEAFPTSLSVLNIASLEHELDKTSTGRLRALEKDFLNDVHVEHALRARNVKAFQEYLLQSYRRAIIYYVESSIVVWRALNHDYDRLLRLSQIASSTLETAFFLNFEKLGRQPFLDTVSGLRVLARVAEWVILGEKSKNAGVLPIDYLSKISLVTFLTWAVLAYITGQVKRPVKANVEEITGAIRFIADQIYRDAIAKGLPEMVGEEQEWFWNVEWQEGAIEAELEKRSGDVKSFSSAESLIRDLNQP